MSLVSFLKDNDDVRERFRQEFKKPDFSTSIDADGITILKLRAEEAAAFEGAGWTFVVPSSEIDEAYERRSVLPNGAEAAGRVYRREDGSTVISTRSLTVKLADNISQAAAEQLLHDANLVIVRRLRFAPNLYEVQVKGQRDSMDTSVLLHENEAFHFAEPIFIEHIAARYVPTDPAFDQQWQWRNDGGGGGGGINAVAAWDHTRGLGIRLAIIDNGFDVTHEDLTAGLALKVSGYFDNTGEYQRTLSGFPDSDHGTFCAGIAGARHNNGVGGCGAAPECEMMLVATHSDQVGTQLTLARSLAYCADPSTEDATIPPAEGSHVISCSLGPSGSSAWTISAVLDEAIRFAVVNGRGGLGTPIFWATSNGNDAVSEDQVCSHPYVIAVGRCNRMDLPDKSAFGPELDLLAPGRDVYSTRSGGQYGMMVGTSFAAPCVAGAAALVLSIRSDLPWDKVRDILRTTADKIGNGYDAAGHSITAGYGRINAGQAVEYAISYRPRLPVMVPTITAPSVVVRLDIPGFEVDMRPNSYYAVEVATDAGLFNPEASGRRRTPDNFYASWEETTPFVDTPVYRLPTPVWDRLKTTSKLYYRVWSNASRTTWLNHIASTPSSLYSQAPFFYVVPSIRAPARISRLDIPVFEVDARPNSYYAVEVATDAGLFNPEASGRRRTPDNFYASWEETTPFVDTPVYRLPTPVWDRLKTTSKLYYRVWSNGSMSKWLNCITSKQSSHYMRSQYIEVEM